MYSKEVEKTFNNTYHSYVVEAIKYAEKYQLAERLQLTNYVDHSVLATSLVISQWRNRAAEMASKFTNIELKTGLDFVENIKRLTDDLETEFEKYLDRHYDDSRRPREIRNAINVLTSQSKKVTLTNISFDPTPEFLDRWGKEWNARLKTYETTGVKSRVLYRRKPRLRR